MSEFKSNIYTHEGVNLHYVEAGHGPLIIFYHGFPSFWYSFHHQMTALSDRFHVVALDGPGINLSDKPQTLGPYQLPNLVAQLNGLAMHLAGHERFHLVGHDWGGALSWAFAQALPDRLHQVVCINAPPANQLIHLLATNSEQRRRSHYMWSMREGKTHQWMTENGARNFWQQAYARFRPLTHYTSADDEIFRQGLAQPGAIDGGINWYRANIPEPDAITDHSYWPSKTATTSVPAMLIWGDEDDTFVPGFIDDLPNYACHLTVRRLEGVGHTPMLEVPEKVNALLLEFLKI